MTEKRFAKYELQTALLDGLFEPVKKVSDGHLKLRQIERFYDYKKDGETIKKAIYLRLRVPYLLNTSAESLLLAILKFSAQQGIRVDGESELETDSDASSKEVAITTTTMYGLMKEAGMKDSKEHYRLANAYLEQMSEIRVYYENKVTGWRGGSWFMRYKAHDDGKVRIQLNWRLSGAIFGEYLHAEINLDERAKLNRDPSKTLHRWLSAHIWQGKDGYMLYDTLASHIWSEEASAATQRKRISRLKTEVLPEIADLPGWTVTLEKEGATIKRK